MEDVTTEPDTATTEMVVTLAVLCSTPLQVAHVTEVLSRPLAALGLDGMHARVAVDHVTDCDDE